MHILLLPRLALVLLLYSNFIMIRYVCKNVLNSLDGFSSSTQTYIRSWKEEHESSWVVENLITRDNLKHNVEKEHIYIFWSAYDDDGYSYGFIFNKAGMKIVEMQMMNVILWHRRGSNVRRKGFSKGEKEKMW